MKRLVYSSIAMAALVGTLVIAQVAEAGNPINRRLRPGQGYWNNGTASQSRSFSNGYSTGTRYYAPQPSYAPQQYAAPQQQYVPQQYAAPQRYYYPQQRTYVVTPSVTTPSQSVTVIPAKPAETTVKTTTPAESETGE